MANYSAILDSCVIYPQMVRDLLLSLACSGLFRARWTDQINREWVEKLLEKNPGRRPQVLRTWELVNQSVEDCLITGYEHRIDFVVLPDRDDRHVVAAALEGNVDVIVTFNLAHFPDDALSPLGLEAQHPDDFVASMISANEELACAAIREMRLRYKKPSMAAAEYLDSLKAKGLLKTSAVLRPLIEQI